MAVFPIFQMALCAGIACVSALLVMSIFRHWFKIRSLRDLIGIAAVVGVAILVWRVVGNTPALNNDPIAGVSPNDVFAPLFTYLMIGWYAAFRQPDDHVRFEQVRVLLTLISFVVNVVTI
jgi:hypothetical protein